MIIRLDFLVCYWYMPVVPAFSGFVNFYKVTLLRVVFLESQGWEGAHLVASVG